MAAAHSRTHNASAPTAPATGASAPPRGVLYPRDVISDASKSIRVVAALVERDGRYLITQRRPTARLPLLWEFPGGRVESGESDAEALRRQAQADIRARVLTAASTARPFAERLAMFWSNHFSLSTAKGAVQGLVGAFEREAIRPHIAGRFADLLYAATTHPAMLRYLDNTASAGPQSAVARRAGAAEGGRPPRGVGLNENLARELLELHTLGAADGTQGGGDGAAVYGPWGGYTQADIVALAAVLSGWRGPMPAQPAAVFDARWHQPGPKRLLGRSYPEGPDALRQVLDDLARHPSTARHLATKLVRHVVADAPPPSLVDRLARRFTDTDGDLAAVADALLTAPEAWQPAPLRKLKSPEEFVVSSARLLRLGERTVQAAPDAGLSALGSPAGWTSLGLSAAPAAWSPGTAVELGSDVLIWWTDAAAVAVSSGSMAITLEVYVLRDRPKLRAPQLAYPYPRRLTRAA